ncbi:MAG: malto-oligosyltrehalose synthase [bacterium]
MHIPVSTYRIQFSPSFDFNSAREIIHYLLELGISDLYASPIFKVRRGSMHGYDVVDPNQLNPELGDTENFERLIAELRSMDMFWLQDIVPNHMAYDSQNEMIMDLLENTENSKFYHFFDIDWDHFYDSLKKKLLTPFLGKFYSESLEDAEIQLRYDQNGLSVNYYSLRLPLRLESYVRVFKHNIKVLEGTLGQNNPELIKFLGTLHLIDDLANIKEFKPEYDQVKHAKGMLWKLYMQNPTIKAFMDANILFFNGEKGQPDSFTHLDDLLAEQPFRLSFWKVAAEEINYRRFFSINDLISLRVEDEEVFTFTHELIFKLVDDKKFDGLRIDHIDGLWDPTTYLERLREKTDQTYIVAEKILDFDEKFPPFWPIQGTTGYDFMNHINGVFCRKGNKKAFSKIYDGFTDFHLSFEDLVPEKKRLIIEKHMAGNIDNLAHIMKKIAVKDRYGKDITLYALKRALVEVMSFFPVYRSYINENKFSDTDKLYISRAIRDALRINPDLVYEMSFIEKFFSPDFSKQLNDEENEQLTYFIMQFQQFTSSIMAKGFEDTVLYIYNKLISLNEVGGNPDRFGVSEEEFHTFSQYRAVHLPHTLNATSTHDTKRGEDVRARINVLSEIPGEWESHLKNWHRINRRFKKRVNSAYMPDGNDEYFLYQTLIGAFPFDAGELPQLTDRIKNYIIKAVREAKRHTAWIKPDTEYEDACLHFVEEILRPGDENIFLKEFMSFQKKIVFYGIFNSLSQTLAKITSPGVPDFYQGTELWDLNLVDPDNRRPVDYQKREYFLKDIRKKSQHDILGLINELLENKEDGRIKLFLIYKALKTRRERQDIFQNGIYIPIKTEGRFRDCIIAYAKNYQDRLAITVIPRFLTNLIKEGVFPLGEQVWEDTRLVLPDELSSFSWTNAITDQPVSGEGPLLAGKIFEHFPVGLLI